jgi:hypothetical protein
MLILYFLWISIALFLIGSIVSIIIIKVVNINGSFFAINVNFDTVEFNIDFLWAIIYGCNCLNAINVILFRIQPSSSGPLGDPLKEGDGGCISRSGCCNYSS